MLQRCLPPNNNGFVSFVIGSKAWPIDHSLFQAQVKANNLN